MSNSITTPNETFGQSESTQAFAKLPKVFSKAPQYKHLKAEHFVAYSFMLDRLQLSISNQMKDKDGTPFIYYAVENVAEEIHCSVKTAGKVIEELKRTGLIRKVKQGQGKPNRIYVHDVFQTDKPKQRSKTRAEENWQAVSKGQSQKCKINVPTPDDFTLPPEDFTLLRQSKIPSNKTDKNNTEISKTDNSNTDSNDTEISKTDNSNYSVNGNERALDGGLMTSDAKDYLLARNEESLVDEVRRLLFKLMRMTPKTICIDNREMNGDVVSERLKNISITQIETALNRVEGNKYSEEERREHLTAELYHVTQETSNQTVQAGVTDSSYQTASQTSNTDALAGISKETQEQNKKELEQMYAEFGDLWN
ncbi:hypothetical protein GPK77_04660 [Butyricicoccus faecihominis]|nr:replication initiator protein A [Butyricicoccus faecihominis]MBT9817019.1 hypothetical protein [Butyricicoccus faecihominis]